MIDTLEPLVSPHAFSSPANWHVYQVLRTLANQQWYHSSCSEGRSKLRCFVGTLIPSVLKRLKEQGCCIVVEGKQHLGGRRTGGTLLLMIQKSVFVHQFDGFMYLNWWDTASRISEPTVFCTHISDLQNLLVVWKKTTFLFMECLGGPVNFQTTPPWTSGWKP